MVRLAPRLLRDYADVARIGIPRGLLFYRYGTLWTTFFAELGREVILSEETDRAIVEAGTLVSVDECCLASKAYMGHVQSLIGRCDAVFVPSYASADVRRGFCTKFQSLTDLVTNTFRDQGLRVVSVRVENATDKKGTRQAFVDLALRLGASAKAANSAWKKAGHAQEVQDADRAAAQERELKALEERRREADKANHVSERPLGILLVSHPYISHDRYICGTVVDELEAMGATVFFADETNHTRAQKASHRFSETMPWLVNRELVGSILLLGDHIDGIVLVSAFPCGPDSMTDDAIMRCIQGKPILNLTIDAQSGTAGIQTRIESFIDILRFQQRGGYVGDRDA